MKRFATKTITFAFIGIMPAIMMVFFSSYLIKENSSFKIPSGIDKIIIGHSHSECAFDDKKISGFANFSSSGESYFYNYFKTVQLLNQNKNIKLVFVEFTNNQISKDANDWIWGDQYINFRYPLYAPFLDFQANKLLFDQNPNGYLKSLSLFIRKSLGIIIDQDYNYTKKIGGYRRLERDETDSILKKANDSEEPEITSLRVSEPNLHYLQKIINLSPEKNIKVYLVRSPIHPKYKGLKNESIFEKVLKNRFSNVEFLDFKNFPLENDEFGDLQHLNFRGAEKFSVFFNELLRNGLLEKIDKQAFINDEIAKIKQFSGLND